jgi:chromate transporter
MNSPKSSSSVPDKDPAPEKDLAPVSADITSQALALETPPPVSFTQAFWFWLKLGFISFGGPAGQTSMMHQELVEQRR